MCCDLTTFTIRNPYQSVVLIAIMKRGRPKTNMTTSTAIVAIKTPGHVGEPLSVICKVMQEIVKHVAIAPHVVRCKSVRRCSASIGSHARPLPACNIEKL